MPAHYDNRQLGAHQFEGRQQLKDGRIGQIDIGDDDVPLPIANPALQRFRRAGCTYGVPRCDERLIDDQADAGIVFGEENSFLTHSFLGLGSGR